MQKILSLSEHEVSEPQNSSSKFLYGLDFLLNKFMAKRHPKSASIYPKMVTARPSNSSFLHLETTCLLICFRISSSFTSQRTLALDSAYHPYYLCLFRWTRGTTLSKKNSKKNGKMYGRSS